MFSCNFNQLNLIQTFNELSKSVIKVVVNASLSIKINNLFKHCL